MPKSHPYPRLSDDAQHELRRCIVDCYTQVPPDARTGRRVQVIRDLHRGFSVKGLSKNFRVSVRSIRQWLATYRRAGVKGLMGNPRPGVHLTGEQIDQLWKLRLQRPKKLPRPKPSSAVPKLRSGEGQPYSAEALTQTCLQQAGTSGKKHVRRSPWSFPRLARWVKAHWGIKVSPKQLARKMLRPARVLVLRDGPTRLPARFAAAPKGEPRQRREAKTRRARQGRPGPRDLGQK